MYPRLIAALFFCFTKDLLCWLQEELFSVIRSMNLRQCDTSGLQGLKMVFISNLLGLHCLLFILQTFLVVGI